MELPGPDTRHTKTLLRTYGKPGEYVWAMGAHMDTLRAAIERAGGDPDYPLYYRPHEWHARYYAELKAEKRRETYVFNKSRRGSLRYGAKGGFRHKKRPIQRGLQGRDFIPFPKKARQSGTGSGTGSGARRYRKPAGASGASEASTGR